MNDNMSEFRFVLTQKCNYKCYFCHKEGIKSVREELLNPDDIASIFKIGKEYFGISSVTLTGGEPLCRNDIISIVKALYEEDCDITITSNGYLLNIYPELGKYISTLNISLHCLNKHTYDNIVGNDDSLEVVRTNIDLFRKLYPDLKICLNVPVIKGVNNSKIELQKLLDYSRTVNASIKFIELYPSSIDGYISKETICNLLVELSCAKISESQRTIHYSYYQQVVRVTRIFCAAAAVAQNPSEFCNQKNDLFILPDGHIKLCRESNEELDILPCVKNRAIHDTYICIKNAYFKLGKKCILKEKK